MSDRHSARPFDPGAYELLQLESAGRRLDVVIAAPPMNVMSVALYRELDRLSQELWDDAGGTTSVVVFRSADPDFFIAHFDVEPLIAQAERPRPTDERPNGFHAMCERFRTAPAISIAEIAGRVGGGGAELSASLDMRFGALDRMVLNQMEVPLGILPGGSGTQRLPRLIGRGRAMEVVVGAVDIDARTAEQWGWLNRALEPSALSDHVDALADRIAGFDPVAVRTAKASVLAAEPDTTEGLATESDLFAGLLHRPDAAAAMRRFLERGGQTRAGEQQMMTLADDLFDAG